MILVSFVNRLFVYSPKVCGGLLLILCYVKLGIAYGPFLIDLIEKGRGDLLGNCTCGRNDGLWVRVLTIL